MEPKLILRFNPPLVRHTSLIISIEIVLKADAYEEFKQNIQVFQNKSERIERDIIDNNSETLEVFLEPIHSIHE